MTCPLALITWFRTQLSVAPAALLCASTLNLFLSARVQRIANVVKNLKPRV